MAGRPSRRFYRLRVTTLFAEVSRPTRQRASRVVGKTWDRLQDPHVQLEVVLALVFLGAITAFGHVVEDYLTDDPIVRWDVEFSRWLHVHSSPALVSSFSVVTWAGNAVVLAAVTLVAVALLYKAGRRRDAYVVLGGALGIELLNAILKLVFHRPRPELAYVHLDTYSFPSGHAAGTAAIYGILLYLVARGPTADDRSGLFGGVCGAGRHDLLQPLPRGALPLRRARRGKPRARVGRRLRPPPRAEHELNA
jgi:hypothetical protein